MVYLSRKQGANSEEGGSKLITMERRETKARSGVDNEMSKTNKQINQKRPPTAIECRGCLDSGDWWWPWKCRADLKRGKSGEWRFLFLLARSGPACDETFARGIGIPGGCEGAAVTDGGVRIWMDEGEEAVSSESEA